LVVDGEVVVLLVEAWLEEPVDDVDPVDPVVPLEAVVPVEPVDPELEEPEEDPVELESSVLPSRQLVRSSNR
jgi:hypothetical protein